jgi:hypothetical protein
MDRDRFQDLLDSRGSDLAAWPEADRIAAERLIASDRSAAKALGDARALESLIRRTLSAEAPEGSRYDAATQIVAGLPGKLPAQEGRDARLAAPLGQVIQFPGRTAARKKPRPFAFFPAQGALMPRVAALTFAAAFGVALGLFWAQKSMLDDRATMIASEQGGSDVAAVIFQSDTAIGTF